MGSGDVKGTNQRSVTSDRKRPLLIRSDQVRAEFTVSRPTMHVTTTTTTTPTRETSGQPYELFLSNLPSNAKTGEIIDSGASKTSGRTQPPQGLEKEKCDAMQCKCNAMRWLDWLEVVWTGMGKRRKHDRLTAIG